jgi:hypothetical protein
MTTCPIEQTDAWRADYPGNRLKIYTRSEPAPLDEIVDAASTPGVVGVHEGENVHGWSIAVGQYDRGGDAPQGTSRGSSASTLSSRRRPRRLPSGRPLLDLLAVLGHLKSFDGRGSVSLRLLYARRPSMNCSKCDKRFAQRVFDLEMQLLAAGWSKTGILWACADCTRRPPKDAPKPVTTCLECNATFGVAFASEEQKMAKGWEPVGDRWVCPACMTAIREENSDAPSRESPMTVQRTD